MGILRFVAAASCALPVALLGCSEPFLTNLSAVPRANEFVCDPAAAATNLAGVVALPVSLTWESGATAEFEFVIERQVNEGGFAEIARVAGDARAASDPSAACLATNTKCQFRVQAERLRDACQTVVSNTVELVAPPVPAAALVAATSSSGTDIVLSWSDGNAFETGYRVERASGDGSAFTIVATLPSVTLGVSAAPLTFTDAGLDLDHGFVYRVVAYTDYGTYTREATADVTAWTSPCTVAQLQIDSVSTTELHLSWIDCATETGYRVERNSAAGLVSATLPQDATSLIESPLQADTQYSFDVFAENSALDAAARQSLPTHAVQWTRPAPLTALAALARSATTVELAWLDGNTHASGYRVERRALGESSFTPLTVIAAPSAGLVDNATSVSAEYRVAVVNPGGDSLAVALTAAGAAMPPWELTVATLAPDSLHVSWQDGNLFETGYRVERRLVGGSYQLVATLAANATTLVESALAEETTYEYRVTALAAGGDAAATASGATSFRPKLSWSGTPSIDGSCTLSAPGAALLDTAHGATLAVASATVATVAPPASVNASSTGLSAVIDPTLAPATFASSWTLQDSLGGATTLNATWALEFATNAVLRTAQIRPSASAGLDMMVGRQVFFDSMVSAVTGCGSLGGRRGSIALGYKHTAVVTAAGTILTWGDNTQGQLGDGTTGSHAAPSLVCASGSAGTCSPLTNVAAVAAGSDHTCALLTSGNVMCWGSCMGGWIANSCGAPQVVPLPVCVSGSGVTCGAGSLLSGAVAVAAGNMHTCALLQSGEVWCWGVNSSAQLGDGTSSGSACGAYTPCRGTPAPVCASGSGSTCSGGAKLTGAVALASANDANCVVLSNGTVKCWGSGALGKLGDGTTTTRTNPAEVCAVGAGPGCIGAGGTTLSGANAVALGQNHSCALLATGTVKCWGAASSGQLGDGTTGDASGRRLNPVDVCAAGAGSGCVGGAVLSGVASVALGAAHTCALLDSGEVACSGAGADLQLGSTPTTNRLNPSAVCAPDSPGCAPLANAIAVGTGYTHSCALSRGGVTCFGHNATGELGFAPTGDTCGADGACALAHPVCAGSPCTPIRTPAYRAGGSVTVTVP